MTGVASQWVDDLTVWALAGVRIRGLTGWVRWRGGSHVGTRGGRMGGEFRVLVGLAIPAHENVGPT
jgi:hypothetical protein